MTDTVVDFEETLAPKHHRAKNIEISVLGDGSISLRYEHDCYIGGYNQGDELEFEIIPAATVEKLVTQLNSILRTAREEQVKIERQASIRRVLGTLPQKEVRDEKA